MNLLFISLGCDKNLVDTEKMLGILGGEGYSFVDDESDADVIVVNTCCFIGKNSAREAEAGRLLSGPKNAIGPSSFFFLARLSAFRASGTMSGLSLYLRVR